MSARMVELQEISGAAAVRHKSEQLLELMQTPKGSWLVQGGAAGEAGAAAAHCGDH